VDSVVSVIENVGANRMARLRPAFPCIQDTRHPYATSLWRLNLEQWALVSFPPWGIGTYARMLRQYVREEESLSLMDAVNKMTLLPATILEAWAPSLRRKGRVRVGADADLTVFDLATVSDHATYGDPLQASTGFEYVIVGGDVVVRAGRGVEDATPGKRVLAPVKEPSR